MSPVTVLSRLLVWGGLLWLARTYSDLAPLATGLVLGDFVTQLVLALLTAHRESLQLAEAACSALFFAVWLQITPLPVRPDHLGTMALGFLAALALRTLPAVWSHLHADQFPPA